MSAKFEGTGPLLKPTGKAKWQVPTRPYPGKRVKEYYLEGELKEKFCKLFPKHSNRRMMQWFGLSFSTLQRFRRELGLVKDMRAIRKELARDVKKICEKNGYYDSIRGRRPSERCIAAIRRKHAEGFCPMLQLKKNNPKRYKRVCKKKSEARKELMRKERLRVTNGLPQHTRLYVPLNRFTSNAYHQKWRMIHHKNYFSVPGHTDWVCYDSLTSRSEKMEATAVKHGLKIVEGEEELNENET